MIKIKNILLTLVIMLSLCFLFACGETKETEKTDLEKVLECKIEKPYNAEIRTIIKVGDTNIYTERITYALENDKYKKTTNINRIGGLDEAETVIDITEEVVDGFKTYEIKNEYLDNPTVNNGKLEASLTQIGLNELVSNDASNGKIIMETADGTIKSIRIDYEQNGQTITICASYNNLIY